MDNLMLCRHKETKPKMVISAYTDRYGYYVYKETKDCCIACGCVASDLKPLLKVTGDH